MTLRLDDDAAVRAALRGAVEELRPRPDFLGDVRSGGRRRLYRRRAAVALSLVALLGAGGAAVAVELPRQSVMTASERHLLDLPTSGDLAGDTLFRDEVLTAWDRSHEVSPNADRRVFDDLRGKARVVWLGHTPIGRGAVVVQEAYVHRGEGVGDDDLGLTVLVGFLSDDGNLLRVVADGFATPGDRASGVYAAVLGQDPRLVMAFDSDRHRLEASDGLTYRPDGRVVRTWTPLGDDATVGIVSAPGAPDVASPDDGDGVGFLAIPDRADPEFVVIRRSGEPDSAGTTWLAGSESRPAGGSIAPDRRLNWTAAADRASYPVLRAGTAAGWGSPDHRALDLVFEGALDRAAGGAAARSTMQSLWFAYGTTPAGARFVVGERQYDDEPSHVYAVLDGHRVVHGGSIDLRAPLPVVVRLPDGGGTVVARYGARLRWRTGGASWSGPATSAALVPAGTTQVEVRLPGKGAEVVDLPQ
jgi:hypothetical protein